MDVDVKGRAGGGAHRGGGGRAERSVVEGARRGVHQPPAPHHARRRHRRVDLPGSPLTDINHCDDRGRGAVTRSDYETGGDTERNVIWNGYTGRLHGTVTRQAVTRNGYRDGYTERLRGRRGGGGVCRTVPSAARWTRIATLNWQNGPPERMREPQAPSSNGDNEQDEGRSRQEATEDEGRSRQE
eukprot:1152688-Prorocentrum_minimum.AAC.2